MKRIVICSDGTWNSPVENAPTHVLRVARAVSPTGADGLEQVVFYDWGIGSDGAKLVGGLTGQGIDKNIMDTYRFIVHNYDPGDQLFFFGFSRGAYTVRSLGGFIRNSGVLKRVHAALIPEAYELYRKRTPRTRPDAPAAVQFRERYAVANTTEIEFIGVWDTVGALGIPVPFWGMLGDRNFLFHDTEPSRIIRHARHALAIDENRVDFQPTLWDPKSGMDVVQVWFAGSHSDVGGGYWNHQLGDWAARWMLEEARSFGLEVEDHLAAQLDPDYGARLHNEYKGLFALRPKVTRELGNAIHHSAKLRWEDPAVQYRSRALNDLLESVDHDWSRLKVV